MYFWLSDNVLWVGALLCVWLSLSVDRECSMGQCCTVLWVSAVLWLFETDTVLWVSAVLWLSDTVLWVSAVVWLSDTVLWVSAVLWLSDTILWVSAVLWLWYCIVGLCSALTLIMYCGSVFCFEFDSLSDYSQCLIMYQVLPVPLYHYQWVSVLLWFTVSLSDNVPLPLYHCQCTVGQCSALIHCFIVW